MDFVIDGNILFAALIKKGVTEKLLVKYGFTFYAPEFLFTEFEKYKSELLTKSHRTEIEFLYLASVFQRRIILIPLDEFSDFLDEAEKISPDSKDTSYIALAMKMNVPLWSNDRQLKEKLKRIKVYSTKELLEL